MRGSRRFPSWLTGLLATAAVLPAVVGVAPRPAAAVAPAAPAGPGAPTAASGGTWLVASDGGVFAFGGAPFYGSLGGLPSSMPVGLNRPVVGLTATPTGRGYWLVASDGGVFAFGDAGFFGSTGALRLSRPIVALAATPSGAGYWLVASDGGVFAFGDAGFFGSTGSVRLSKPIVGMAAAATGRGYWLVASDGGIFTFGDAVFRGGAGGTRLARPIVGMAATPGGRGYWLAAADGGVFSFGDAPFAGSLGTGPGTAGPAPGGSVAGGSVAGSGGPGAGGSGGQLNGTVVAVAAAPRGLGYWLVGADGGIFAFGDATFDGSLGGLRLRAPIVGLAPRPVIAPAEVPIFFYPWYATPGSRTGYRHWEQNGHTPPDDIGANFYPAGGLYSSLDPAVLARQARQMAASGVDEVVSSWWGRGSYEDWMLPDLVAAVRTSGLRPAIHIEPYRGRTPASVAADLVYLAKLGIRDVWLYQADTSGPAADWAPVVASFPDIRFFAETGNLASMLSGAFADFAATAGFDGLYTYDAIRYDAPEMAATCAAARQRRLLCAPSVAPGFDARRSGGGRLGVVPPAGGLRYDTLWRAALAAGADAVSITSWNEWHEGTQIEPAQPWCFLSDGYCSPGYGGVYGRTGPAAQTAYMDATADWSARFHTLRPPG